MSKCGESRTVISPRGSTNPEMRWMSSIDSVSLAGSLVVTPYTVKKVCER
jgi:hypothetical protein